MLFAPGGNRVFTTRDGLPNNEIFSIREARNGDLLIARARRPGAHARRPLLHLRAARPAGAADHFRRAGGSAPAASGWRRPAGWTSCAARISGSWFRARRMLASAMVALGRGRRRRHLGRHLRQGSLAREGRRSAPVHHRRRGSPATRSARSTRTATARSGSAPSAAAWRVCRDGKFYAVHRAGRPAQRQRRATFPTTANRSG